MKTYPVVDLTSDPILNPAWPENSRPVSWINQIVVHHSGTFRQHDYDDLTSMRGEAQYQNNTSIPGSKGLMYHYSISNTGDIYHVRPHNILLWHDGNYPSNQHSIAIKLDGNLSEQNPTQEQFEALKQLLDDLSTNHPEFPAAQGDAYGHRHFYNTNCPGDNLIGWVDAYRNNMGHIEPLQVGYDHPELQPNYVAPLPLEPVVVAPAPVVIEPNVIPILDVEKPDYERSFVAFPETSHLTTYSDTEAVDAEALGANKPYPAGTRFALSGTFTEGNKSYYRGTSGSWYGLPVEAFNNGQPSGDIPVKVSSVFTAAAVSNELSKGASLVRRFFHFLVDFFTIKPR